MDSHPQNFLWEVHTDRESSVVNRSAAIPSGSSSGGSPQLTYGGPRHKMYTKLPSVPARCIGIRFPGLGPFARLRASTIYSLYFFLIFFC
jgi:hypothetical protein